MALPIFGGALDGGEAKAIGGKYIYISEQGQPSRTPTPGSHVYIRESTRYRFAGYHHRVCAGCGSHLHREGADQPPAADRCPLCGHSARKERRRD